MKLLVVFSCIATLSVALAGPAAASLPGANGRLVISAATQQGVAECGDPSGPPRAVARVADVLCAERSPVPYAIYFSGPGRELERWRLSGGGYWMGTLTAGGRQALLFRGAVSALYLAAVRPGAAPVPLRRNGRDPAASADGRRVAYRRGELWGAPGPPGGVYVAPTGRGAARYLGDGANPRWSSRGRLAYDVIQGDGRLWRGTGIAVTDTRATAPKIIRASAGEELALQDWSPNGRELLVVRSQQTTSDARSALYAMRPDGTHARRLTSFVTGPEARFCVDAVWSPDGRRIAFLQKDGAGGSTVYTASAVTRTPQESRSWRRVLVGANALHDWAPRTR